CDGLGAPGPRGKHRIPASGPTGCELTYPNAKPRKKLVMAIPFFKEMRIGGYLLKQKMLGRKRYPLVLMLEPLFRCNLACVGCGKMDYPDAILNPRVPPREACDAADRRRSAIAASP